MTKRNKQLREIYLLAAEHITTQWDYCCNVIRRASRQLQIKDEGDLATELFQFLYRPEPNSGFFWLQAELARTDSLPNLSEIQPA